MEQIQAENIVPVGEFKRQAARYLRRLVTEPGPVVITQNGKAAAVMVAPGAYDALQRRMQLLEDLARSEEDLEAGRTMTSGELRTWMAQRRGQR